MADIEEKRVVGPTRRSCVIHLYLDLHRHILISDGRLLRFQICTFTINISDKNSSTVTQ